MIVKDKSGKQIGSISGLPPIIDLKWDDAGCDCLVITDPPSDKSIGILYDFSVKTRKLRRITYGVSGNWKIGRRYVSVPIQNDLSARGELISGIAGCSKLLILDPAGHFSTTTQIGPLIMSNDFSPDGGKIAYIERMKDEYGDLELYVLKVMDISRHKVRTIAQGRRDPEFVWQSDKSLAVTTYDRYAVPTLSLMTLDGYVTKLLTARQYSKITPVGTPKVAGSVVYQSFTARQEADYREGDLWSVRPGGKPVLIHSIQPMKPRR